jgi:hypothetical protein
VGVPGNKIPVRHTVDNPDAAVVAVAGDCLGERRIKTDDLLLARDVRIDTQGVRHTEGRTALCQRLARWKAACLSHCSSLDSRGIVMVVDSVHNTTILGQFALQEEHSLAQKRWNDARENSLVTDEMETRGFAGEGCSDRATGTESAAALPGTSRESKSSPVDLPASCHNSERLCSALHAYQRAFLNQRVPKTGDTIGPHDRAERSSEFRFKSTDGFVQLLDARFAKDSTGGRGLHAVDKGSEQCDILCLQGRQFVAGVNSWCDLHINKTLLNKVSYMRLR